MCKPPASFMAIESGADFVEHFVESEEELDLAAEKGITWTPTLSVLDSVSKSLEARHKDPDANLIHDLGYLDACLLYSFIQLVLCDEIVDWIGSRERAIDVSPQALAVDLIADLGPGGQYLDTDHTLGHYRQRWYPRLFERHTFSGWQNRGSKALSGRASERVNQILEKHRPEGLPAETRRQMRAIIERAKAGS